LGQFFYETADKIKRAG